MVELIGIDKNEDILPELRGTPIAHLLEYHNLGRSLDACDKARLLIGMCIDNRKHLRLPNNFAFIIRTGGANLRYSEFKISYCIAIGGIRHIALIGHNNCGMVNLMSRKEQFIKGLVDNAGWSTERAHDHFMHFAPMFEVDNEIEFTLNEARRINGRYPTMQVVPMLYCIEDNRLYLIIE